MVNGCELVLFFEAAMHTFLVLLQTETHNHLQYPSHGACLSRAAACPSRSSAWLEKCVPPPINWESPHVTGPLRGRGRVGSMKPMMLFVLLET